MTDTEIRIVKRISMYMIERANQSQGNSIRQKEFTCPVCHKMTTLVDVDVNAERDMAFFQGLGLALGVSFEEIVGRVLKISHLLIYLSGQEIFQT